MLVAGLGLKGSDFVVVTPYRASLDQIQLALQDSKLPAECKNVEVSTTDSFQGGEGTIVIFVLTVNAGTGPQFVAGMIPIFPLKAVGLLTFWTDPHRVCLGITRHKAALVVVGDIDTVAKSKSAFGDLLRWFSSHKRVASVMPDKIMPAAPPAQAPGWKSGGVNAHSGVNWD